MFEKYEQLLENSVKVTPQWLKILKDFEESGNCQTIDEIYSELKDKNHLFVKNRYKKHLPIRGCINDIGLYITDETARNLKYKLQKG